MAGDEDARARRERAEALRRRIAKEKAGESSGSPSSPRELVEEAMRDLERADERDRERAGNDGERES